MLFNYFYYYNLCHYCKKFSKQLYQCNVCKVVSYCSSEHEKEDWLNHYEICAAIAKTNTLMGPISDCSTTEFNNYKFSRGLLLRKELNRELLSHENHMWMFPKICAVCYNTDANISCEKCLSVVYCTKEHQAHHFRRHQHVCKSLKVCMLLHSNYEMETVNMTTYFSNVFTLPYSLHDIVTMMDIKPVKDHESKEYLKYISVYEYLSLPASILLGLENCNYINNRNGLKTDLVIHIIGPYLDEIAINWHLLIELINHWIVNQKSCTVYFIYPLLAQLPSKINKIHLNSFCSYCKSESILGFLYLIPDHYHNVINDIKKPDIVVSFNSSLHTFKNTNFDVWENNISKLIRNPGVPLLLTAYTRSDLMKDLARFKEFNVNVIMKPQNNRFASVRPLRNWQMSESVCSGNGYIAMICQSDY